MKDKTKLPPIIENGETDNTKAIQMRIDRGIPVIIKKGKTILIKKPIRFPKNKEIKITGEP